MKKIISKLIDGGYQLDKEELALIKLYLTKFKYEQVSRYIDEIISNKKPLSELSNIDKERELKGEDLELGSLTAKTIVLYSVLKKITIDDDYWKVNRFADITDQEYENGKLFLQQHREEMLELYETYKK